MSACTHTYVYVFTETIIVQEVNVPAADVEQLLVSLLLDNRVETTFIKLTGYCSAVTG